MASYQLPRPEDDPEANPDLGTLTQGGTGPEYDYPTTKKDEPIPVVPLSHEDVELKTADDPAHAPGENAPPMSAAEAAREEELENAEAGEWSEDMAENEPRPGEVEDDLDLLPLPSDRG